MLCGSAADRVNRAISSCFTVENISDLPNIKTQLAILAQNLRYLLFQSHDSLYLIDRFSFSDSRCKRLTQLPTANNTQYISMACFTEDHAVILCGNFSKIPFCFIFINLVCLKWLFRRWLRIHKCHNQSFLCVT